MGTEIERKFLVQGTAWRTGPGELYRQGYLSRVPERTVRVRVVGSQGYLTVKGLTQGISRPEFEYPISLEDAEFMLNLLCEKPLIEKMRFKVEHAGLIWEIDEFLSENQGLIVAEIEMNDEHQFVALPEWVGDEVSGDERYYNSSLAKHPFQKWADKPAVKKYPEGWIEGVNPVLDKYLDEVRSRRTIDTRSKAIFWMRTFLRVEKNVELDPYQINEDILSLYGVELEAYLEQRYQQIRW